MHRDRAADAVKRAIERLHAVAARFIRMLLHPRFIDLHHVGAGGKEILDLGVNGVCVRHRHRFLVAVIVVLRLAAHGEWARHSCFDHAIGVGAQHFEIAQFDRLPAADRPGDARHRNWPAIPVDHNARFFDVDAVERGGKAIGIAFAALLAVADDIEAGALLIADGEDRRVILRRFELVRRDQPQIIRPHARHLLGQFFAVDQPIRLRIRADERGRK